MKLQILTLWLAWLLILAGMQATLAGEEDEVLLNNDAEGKADASSPVLAGLPDSSLLVVWIDARRGHTDVFSAQTGLDGQLLNPIHLLNDDNKMTGQGNPDLDVAPDGSMAWAVWLDSREGFDVYAQRLSPDGTPMGTNILVPQEGVTANPGQPTVAVAPDGTAFVAWHEFNSFSLEYSIRGRLIAPDGTPLGDGYTEIRESGLMPSAAYNPTAGWALVWEEQTEGGTDCWFARYDDQLSQVGFAFLVSEVTDGDQLDPQVALRPDSTSVVAWRDTRGGGANIFLRFFSPDGLPTSPDIPVQEDDPRQEKDLALAVQSNGSFMVGWHGVDETGDWIPAARGFSADGAPNGPVFQVDNPEDVVSASLSVTPLADGRYACAWKDERTGPGLLYMKLADPPLSFPEFAIPLLHLEPGAAQAFPDVALHEDGSGMVVWIDQRTGSPNLFGQMLDTNGNPTGSNFIISERPLGRFGDPFNITTFLVSTPEVAAADSGNYLVTWFSASEGGAGVVLAQVFDETGASSGFNFPVAPEHAATAQASPSALVDDLTGRMAVVWEDNINDAGGDVFIRRYTPAGQTDGDIIPLVDGDRIQAAQVLPSADISPLGEILVVWVDDRNGGNDIYAQKYDIEDDPEIDNFLVRGEEIGINFPQLNPDVAIGFSSYMVVWDEDSDGTFSVHGFFEAFETLNGKDQAAVQPLNFVVSETPEGDHQHFPKVSMDKGSRIVVTWWDNYEGQAKILGRLYETDGTPATDPFLVTPLREEASRFSPSVDAPGDSIQFVFADSRNWRGWDVFTRRADWGFEGDSIPDIVPVFVSQAGILPLEDGVRVQWISPLDLMPSSFSIQRRGPLLNPEDPLSGHLSEFSGVAWIDRAVGLMGWTDHDVTPGESYAYWILLGEHGTVAGPIRATYDPTTLAVLRAYPTPFADKVTLRLPPAEGRRLLQIYDARGRRVWEAAWPGGSDPLLVTWDGRDSRGHRTSQGVYWARFRGQGDQQTTRLLRLVR